MKNLLIFISPIKAFFGESGTLAKIQIDNSLDLGWKREDILLATNFEFEYNGVRSIVVSNNNFLPHSKTESKQMAILELFDRGFFSNEELYWFHDLDAYQSEVITESELGMDRFDIAMTKYGWRERWSTGSIFFKTSAEDIFKGIIRTFNLLRLTDEAALTILTNGLTKEDIDRLRLTNNSELTNRIPKIRNLNRRIKMINISYNFFALVNPRLCYTLATKPIKVAHFHPFVQYSSPPVPRMLNFYMYGDNEINTVFMSKRLIKIFRQHGVK